MTKYFCKLDALTPVTIVFRTSPLSCMVKSETCLKNKKVDMNVTLRRSHKLLTLLELRQFALDRICLP